MTASSVHPPRPPSTTATVHGDDQPVRRKKHKPSIKVAALNITSFMDLTFNLLLFFVLTASFSVGEGIMPADLPVGGSGGVTAPGAPVAPKIPLFIHLSNFGTLDQVAIQFDNLSVRPADFEELYAMLSKWRHDGLYGPDNPVIIRPERDVLWAHVVDAFNAVVRARYKNVSFQAVPAS